ncbi:MAG: Hpt domain-containing protein [Selenomonadaceae bacterium]|nr:Hpt domain-containing protein [Selenomonadaceae bacterium]
MLTIETLKEFGIDTKEGITRCMNNETFYFKMVSMGLANEYFEKLETTLAGNDLEEAFEAAHALKGVVGNLAITPLYEPLSEITELLRAHKEADYVNMYKPVKELRDKLLALC